MWKKLKLEGEKTRLIQTTSLSSFYIIVDKTEATPIGFFALSETNELLGFFIEPEYRRQGYASDVINTLKKHINGLHITTSLNNVSMQKLLNKLGFKKFYKYE